MDFITFHARTALYNRADIFSHKVNGYLSAIFIVVQLHNEMCKDVKLHTSSVQKVQRDMQLHISDVKECGVTVLNV